VTFAHPQLLWLLAVPAALLLATALRRAASPTATHPKIPRASLRNRTLVLGHWSFQRRPLCAIFALSLLTLALARPQGATIATPALTESRDVLVAVDVSRSMLADDVAPNRLARAQLLVRNLADELRGERLGLLPFAGTAFLQSPLSADYEIFRTFLDELGPDMIPAGGSNFAALLRIADEAFGADSADEQERPDRFLVILSDGEAEDDTWRPLARRLAERGVRVLALGLGTTAGAMIPDGQGAFVKDHRGAVVLSRLEPATLQELARVTEGAYRDASAWVDLPALLRDTIARGRAARVATETTPRREELFAWFLAPALALLGLSLLREFPVVPRTTRVSKLQLRPMSPPRSVARVLPLGLALACALGLAPRAPAADEPDPLVALVARLAEGDSLSAADLARLGDLTAEQGEQARAASSAFPEGAVRDALAAVAAGQRADARAADWPALRQRLEALLAQPPKPEQQQQQQQNQPKKDPPQQQDQQNQQNQQNQQDQSDQSESSDSQNDQPPRQPSAEDSRPDAGSEPQPAPSEQPLADEPTQQAGGVSTSGRQAEREGDGDPASQDPALAVPRQRLERVRDADAPARLFQLMQEADPDARDKRPAAPRQTW
jgi:Ca-activated chloride channel family protein